MDFKRILTSVSFRRKLLLLFLVIFLPAFGVIIATGIGQRQHAIAKAQDDALLLVRSLAAQQEQIAIATKALLNTMALLHEVQNLDAPACTQLFKELHQRYPFYSIILACTPDGKVFASSAPFKPDTNLADRKHIKDAISSLDFSVGEYIIGRVSGMNSLNYTFPVFDAQQKLVAVLIAGFNLQEFGRFLSTANLPEGSAVIFTDHKGVRLYRVPEHETTSIGKPIHKDIFNSMSGRAAEGVFEWTSLDGIKRINSFKHLHLKEESPPYLYMVVGLPKNIILHKANLNMLLNLLILGVTALVALFLAWILGNVVLIRPINRLVAATQQFGTGKMDTRTGLPHTPDELGRLAQSFDEMAALAEQRSLERNRAEEALREEEEAERRRTVELQAVLDAVPAYILFAHDPDCRNITGNSAIYKLVNLPSGSNLSKSAAKEERLETFRTMRDEREIPPQEFPVQRAAATGEPVYDYEFDVVSANGTTRRLLGNAVPLLEKDGHPRGAVGAFIDISDRKKGEEERLRLSKLESLGILAGGIAHDFNNILTSILGNIGLALLNKKIDEEDMESLVEAENACLIAQDLSRQLLTFAKGGVPIKKVVSLIKLVRELTRLALAGSNSLCELSFPDDLWAVAIDEGQISQVFNNLLINADQAMPSGGLIKIEAKNISIKEGSDLLLSIGRYIKLSISDQGIGIPSQYLNNIFDPYFTTKQTGSGLGLATAYSVIKKHSGYIKVQSNWAVGTTFEIYLPATLEEPSTLLEESVTPISGKGKVLVMDDDKRIREVLCRMLRKLGYEADSASDGSQAIAIFVESKKSGQMFDAIILDLTVPGGIGGKETIEKLLMIDPKVKCIVSSGYSDYLIMANFKQYWFSAVIAKPYRLVEMSKILQRVMIKVAH